MNYARLAVLGGSGFDAIDPYSLKRALERINKLRDPTAASGDLDFQRHLRRATSPVPPLDGPPPVDSRVFGPIRDRPVEVSVSRSSPAAGAAAASRPSAPREHSRSPESSRRRSPAARDR